MKSLLAVLFIASATSAYAVSPATTEELGKLWAQAIKDNSTEQLKLLIHPDCANGVIKDSILNRMVSGGLPPMYTVDTRDITTPPEQLDKMFLVRPSKDLLIHYTTNEEDHRRYGLGKGFPIAQKDGHWYFAVCTKKS